MESKIPQEQWAVMLDQPNKYSIQKVRVPVPQLGQVLIKIECLLIKLGLKHKKTYLII
jgi:hypothetical protein